jgi:protein-disulfide isomerase
MKISFVAPASASLLLLLAACGREPADTGMAGAPAARETEARAPSAQKNTLAEAPTAVKQNVVDANSESGVKQAAIVGEDEHCNCKGGECNTEAAEDTEVHDVRLGSAPIRGSAKAPVTIVVFTDFECPFCAKAEATLHEIEAKYGDRVRVAFKHSPLPMHDNARLASRAAVAAAEQGKFWEYHDVVFSHQKALGRDALLGYAKDLGLDLVKFRAAMDSERSVAAIDADIAEAKRLSVMGTPAFFVNGRRIVGAQPLASFETVIDAALANAR